MDGEAEKAGLVDSRYTGLEWRRGKGKWDAFIFFPTSSQGVVGGYFFLQTLLLADGDSIFNALLIIWFFSSRFHSTPCGRSWQSLHVGFFLFVISAPFYPFLIVASPSRWFIIFWLLPQLPKEYLSQIYWHINSSMMTWLVPRLSCVQILS